MKIAVLGASGTIGSLISNELEKRGHEVARLSRSTGVDVFNAESLTPALAGVDVLVDAVNTQVHNAKKAEKVFTTRANNVVAAAEANNVPKIVHVGIYGTSDPAVARGYGYYHGKAVQEQIYRDSPIDVDFIHSTQWFELLAPMVDITTFGPIAMVPSMQIAPLPAADAAQLVCDVATGDAHTDESNVITIRGAEEAQASEFARRILKARGHLGAKKPKWVGHLPYFGKAIGTGGLVPATADRTVSTTAEEWAAANP